MSVRRSHHQVLSHKIQQSLPFNRVGKGDMRRAAATLRVAATFAPPPHTKLMTCVIVGRSVCTEEWTEATANCDTREVPVVCGVDMPRLGWRYTASGRRCRERRHRNRGDADARCCRPPQWRVRSR